MVPRIWNWKTSRFLTSMIETRYAAALGDSFLFWIRNPIIRRNTAFNASFLRIKWDTGWVAETRFNLSRHFLMERLTHVYSYNISHVWKILFKAQSILSRHMPFYLSCSPWLNKVLSELGHMLQIWQEPSVPVSNPTQNANLGIMKIFLNKKVQIFLRNS